ncbi:putative RNA methyltransferase [Christensenella intestinihominis]|uniref:putative RNA methyltransferase n=1 Tax=Christensenella intestinihominis TaxID=1851429 RepID=UPI00082CF941|nr:methyltransferase domain-containing protein [Christensenella intestinihominis]
MKIKTVVQKFRGSEDFFRCPICKKPFSLEETGSFLCTNGHCFDLSAKGYVNFLSGSGGDERYGRDLFESRKTVFEEGFYAPVLEAVRAVFGEYMPAGPRAVLDAGCGEGYYARMLADTGADIYAMDNAREAILSACRESGDVRCAVADLANIPAGNGSAGAILNILSPANYGEFARVLAPGGVLIKAVPGKHYLRELRQCVAERLSHAEYSNEKIIGHMAENADIADHRSIEYTLPVSERQLRAFYRMTPLTSRIPMKEADLSRIRGITVHMEIFAAFFPGGVL